MKRLKTVLTANPGDADAGKEHFTKRCGNCHQLFGEGKKVGPPLDGYERGNVNFWLHAIVEPSFGDPRGISVVIWRSRSTDVPSTG